nr:FAD/NAD(P)-binding oxidoreductase [Thalassorhabdomicrobium marinisediminis]
MAAMTAARSGLDVILAEEDSRMGGRLLAEVEEVDGQPGAVWAAARVAELRAMENVRLMPRTTVTGAYDQGTYAALERVGHHVAERTGPRECFWRIVAQRAILCAGALERPVAFPDNDRPGIMTASAVRAYLNRWGVAPGQTLSIFANNDDAHRTALDFIEAGLEVAAVIDSRADAQPLGDYRVIGAARSPAPPGGTGCRASASRIRGARKTCAPIVWPSRADGIPRCI